MCDAPMLRELNVVEQTYCAVLEVLSGIPVIEVAERYGVARQTIRRWMPRYRLDEIAGFSGSLTSPEAASVADTRARSGGDL